MRERVSKRRARFSVADQAPSSEQVSLHGTNGDATFVDRGSCVFVIDGAPLEPRTRDALIEAAGK
jgi:hypothetical protein